MMDVDEKKALKLLDDLEKLNGLPLEKEGRKIKNGLNIGKTLERKVENISSPYILIEGDRDKAIRLAGYIYLEKSTVYSSVYLRGNDMGIHDTAPLRKAKNPEPQSPLPWNQGRMPMKASRVYVELCHYKGRLRGKQYILDPKSQHQAQNEKTCFVMYRYVNQNGFVEMELSYPEDCRHYHLKFVDYYKNTKEGRVMGRKNNFRALVDEYQAEHTCGITEAMKAIARLHPDKHAKYIASSKEPSNDNHKFIRKVIYSNNFGYVDWENSCPSNLLKLEIMDQGNTTSMTMFDMLKYKSTVFLLDFMKGIEEKGCDELLEFAKKLYALKKDTPGFLIIHVDKIKGLPEYFLEQFEPIPLGSGEKGITLSDGKEIVNVTLPDTKKALDTPKLKLVINMREVYWCGFPLSTIKGKDFDILHELAKTPGSLVKNDNIYRLIDSDSHKGVLLNQRISKIRKSFPSPYNDLTHPLCIIPDAKQNKGYCYLNLTQDQVEISK